MSGKKQRFGANLTYVGVPLSREERSRLDAVCGPGRRVKRGQWVRDAIVAALGREVDDAAALGESKRTSA